jgi:alpha-glucoside transport system substrate-binding protein
VLGPWTGEEGKAFEAALNRLDDGTGRTYTYEGTRSLRETLVSQLEADAPPDVAILNSIGELTEYARRDELKPLAEETAERAYPPWAPTLLVDGRRRTYWVPLKVDLKSLVWSKEGTSSDDPAWCVGLASQATSGWPGTDWVEDILLHQAGPAVYEEWATSRLSWLDPAVERAWTTWAELLGKRSPKSIERSLTTSYEGVPGPDGPRGLLDSPGFDCSDVRRTSSPGRSSSPRPRSCAPSPPRWRSRPRTGPGDDRAVRIAQHPGRVRVGAQPPLVPRSPGTILKA